MKNIEAKSGLTLATFVFVLVLICTFNAAAKLPAVSQTRPRVYLTPVDVADLRNKIELEEFAFSWQRVSSSTNPAAMALTYMLSNDEAKGRKAVEQALADLKKSSGYARWYEPVHYAACVYDWCYGLLTEQEKTEYIAEFERIAALTRAGYPARLNTPPIGSGASEGTILTSQLPAGLAIYDEQPKMFDAAVELFFHSFKPARDFYYAGHSHHQGSDYINRLMYDMFGSWLFRRMGAGNVLSVEQQYIPYAMLYNRRPDWRQMRRSDTFDITGHSGSKRVLAMLVGTYYKDPYLIKYADEPIWASMAADSSLATETGNHIWDWGWGTDLAEVFHLIFREPNLPQSDFSQLPLTKYFAEPIGDMVMRTGWNMWKNDNPGNDALIFMRLGGTYFHGHQHRDMGTFQIYYKGPLATVSGVYQSSDTHSGTDHWKSYYHQTISHNGLLIFDPDEDLVNETYRGANDGGQLMPNSGYYPSHANLQTRYKLGQVTSRSFGTSQSNPDYSYISGNITKAYSSKVRLVTRSMAAINLKDDKYPAALVTFDRIESTNQDFKKTWLQHSHTQPTINGSTITVVNNQQFNMFDGQWSQQNYSGKLVTQSLLPQSGKIVAIGGQGKEFWLESTQRNYAVSWRENDEPGAWRIEVSPVNKQKRDNFLHVMIVMDENEPNYPKAQLIENEQIAGAAFLDRAVIFGKSGQMLSEVSFTLGDGGSTKILVCDLLPGKWQVSRDSKVIAKDVVTPGGNVLYFTDEPNGTSEYRLKIITE